MVINIEVEYVVIKECEMFGFKTVSIQKILPESERKRQDYISLKNAWDSLNKNKVEQNITTNY